MTCRAVARAKRQLVESARLRSYRASARHHPSLLASLAAKDGGAGEEIRTLDIRLGKHSVLNGLSCPEATPSCTPVDTPESPSGLEGTDVDRNGPEDGIANGTCTVSLSDVVSAMKELPAEIRRRIAEELVEGEGSCSRTEGE